MALSNTDVQTLRQPCAKMETPAARKAVSVLWKEAISQRQMLAGRAFHVGMTVQFVSKYGETVVGTITKINPKSIALTSTSGANWKVSPSLLKLSNKKAA